VNAGSDPDMIENDGGSVGLGRRQGFLGFDLPPRRLERLKFPRDRRSCPF
jgi:hypothetical protein